MMPVMPASANNGANNIPTRLAPADVAGLVRGPGRPRGSRNRATREIRALAGKYSLRAVKATWKLATSADNEQTRLRAIELLLAYAHGRPVAHQELTGADGEPLNDRHYDPLEIAKSIAFIFEQAKRAPAASREVPPLTTHYDAAGLEAWTRGSDSAEAPEPEPAPAPEPVDLAADDAAWAEVQKANGGGSDD